MGVDYCTTVGFGHIAETVVAVGHIVEAVAAVVGHMIATVVGHIAADHIAADLADQIVVGPVEPDHTGHGSVAHKPGIVVLEMELELGAGVVGFRTVGPGIALAVLVVH